MMPITQVLAYATILAAILLNIPKLFTVLQQPTEQPSYKAPIKSSTKVKSVEEQSDSAGTSLTTLYFELFYYILLFSFVYNAIPQQNFIPTNILNINNIITVITSTSAIIVWFIKNKRTIRKKPKMVATLFLLGCLAFFINNRLLYTKQITYLPTNQGQTNDTISSDLRKVVTYNLNYYVIDYVILLPTFIQMYRHLTTISLHFIHKALHASIKPYGLITGLFYYSLNLVLLIITTQMEDDNFLLSSSSPLLNDDNQEAFDILGKTRYSMKLLVLHYALLCIYHTILLIQCMLFTSTANLEDNFQKIASAKNNEEIQHDKVRQDALAHFNKVTSDDVQVDDDAQMKKAKALAEKVAKLNNTQNKQQQQQQKVDNTTCDSQKSTNVVRKKVKG